MPIWPRVNQGYIQVEKSTSIDPSTTILEVFKRTLKKSWQMDLLTQRSTQNLFKTQWELKVNTPVNREVEDPYVIELVNIT